MKRILNFVTLILITGIIIFVSCKKEKSCEGCTDKNKPPISIAGPDRVITLPTDSVLLDGSNSSDPDGMICGWLWTKISGPASFTINNPPTSNTIVKNLAAGVYQFELKVTDDGGLSSKDTMSVIVDAVVTTNHPPIANAGADQTITLPTNTITLNGSNSTDPENNITGYAWTKISGPLSFSITSANAVQTGVTNLIEGIYQFELKITDAVGLFSKDTVQVIVNPSSEAPDANAGPDIIITLPLDSVYLGGGSSSMIPVTYQWTNISGPGVVSMISSTIFSGTILVKGLIPGLYFFRLEVSNAVGMSADTVSVLVINDPQNTNTITFKNLKWRLADEYGSGIIDLDIITPGQPNLFVAWDQLRPVEIYLQLDSLAQWFLVSSIQSGIMYNYDAASPHIWIARIPREDLWVGKESSVRIKLL
jgi:hypothetical protein